jgi:DNA-binding transcriptional LysR family regulator
MDPGLSWASRSADSELDLDLEAEAPLWLLSHEEANRNVRVRAMFDFLTRRFRQDRRPWFS